MEPEAFGGIGEVAVNQDDAEMLAERRVMEAGEKVGIDSSDDGPAAFGRGLPGIIERRPAAVAVEMEERQANVRPLRAAMGNHSPEGEKAEGEFAGKRQYRLREFAFFDKPGNGEQQHRLVWGNAVGTINLEVGGNSQPAVFVFVHTVGYVARARDSSTSSE